MKSRKMIAFIATTLLGIGVFKTAPVYASIWDLPGAPDRTEASNEEVEEYFANYDTLEAMREGITEEDALTEEAQCDLLLLGPASIYARAAGDTPGEWYVDPATLRYRFRLTDGSDARAQWIKDNGEWYYLDADGFMKSGLFWVDGNAYYCNASGVMQTGWQALTANPVVDDGWYYFDANGAWLVRTDTKGCEHGVLCLCPSHYHLSSRNIRYRNLVGVNYDTRIRSGMNMWKNATDIISIQEVTDSSFNVMYMGSKTLGESTIARTQFLKNGEYTSSSNLNSNWSSSKILINTVTDSFVSGTAAHETGHAMGLSHHTDSRYGYRYSIMYPVKNSARKIQIYDVNVVGHLYNY